MVIMLDLVEESDWGVRVAKPPEKNNAILGNSLWILGNEQEILLNDTFTLDI